MTSAVRDWGWVRTEDYLRWNLVANVSFRVKSFFHIFVGGTNTCFPQIAIWGTSGPTNISLFISCAAKNKTLTLGNLIWHRKVIVNRCCMCLSDVESVAHLLIQCPFGMELWATVFCFFYLWWDIQCVFLVRWQADSRTVWGQSGQMRTKTLDFDPYLLDVVAYLERVEQMIFCWGGEAFVYT